MFLLIFQSFSGMERDLAAIKAKLASLESEASKIEGTHPEEAEVVIERITKLSQSWEQLTAMLTVRDAKLEEAGDLHRFLKDLDHFQVFFFFRLKFPKTSNSVLPEKAKSKICTGSSRTWIIGSFR